MNAGEPIRVRAYSGWRGEEEPREVEIGGRWLPVERIERAWREPGARWFRVEVRSGAHEVLCCLDADLTWWRVT